MRPTFLSPRLVRSSLLVNHLDGAGWRKGSSTKDRRTVVEETSPDEDMLMEILRSTTETDRQTIPVSVYVTSTSIVVSSCKHDPRIGLAECCFPPPFPTGWT